MASAVLFLRAQTSLHPGTGASVGAIDLPIQRERHTEWPMIQSSSLKGVLRDLYRLQLIHDKVCETHEGADQHAEVVEVFGPPTDQRDEHHAGALAVSDARILAFPVRSARGVFAWATCRGVAERLTSDLALLSTQARPPSCPEVTADQAVGYVGAMPRIGIEVGDSTALVLEDVMLSLVPEREATSNDMADWIFRGAKVAGQPDGVSPKRLVIVHDDAFSYLVKHTTEIVQRIKLSPETKTVQTGALFTQELLPPETIMYSLLLADAPRRNAEKAAFSSADEVLKAVSARCDGKPLQIGGDETTGKGWCWASVLLSEQLAR